MKLKFDHLILISALLLAFATNPSEAEHRQRIEQAVAPRETGLLQRLLTDDNDLPGQCIYYNYGLFSFTEYRGAVISVGLLHNVHISYRNVSAVESG